MAATRARRSASVSSIVMPAVAASARSCSTRAERRDLLAGTGSEQAGAQQRQVRVGAGGELAAVRRAAPAGRARRRQWRLHQPGERRLDDERVAEQRLERLPERDLVPPDQGEVLGVLRCGRGSGGSSARAASRRSAAACGGRRRIERSRLSRLRSTAASSAVGDGERRCRPGARQFRSCTVRSPSAHGRRYRAGAGAAAMSRSRRRCRVDVAGPVRTWSTAIRSASRSSSSSRAAGDRCAPFRSAGGSELRCCCGLRSASACASASSRSRSRPGSGTRDVRPRAVRSPRSRSDSGTSTGSASHHDVVAPARPVVLVGADEKVPRRVGAERRVEDAGARSSCPLRRTRRRAAAVRAPGDAGAGGGEHPLGVRDELAQRLLGGCTQLRRPGPAPPPGVPGGELLPVCSGAAR